MVYTLPTLSEINHWYHHQKSSISKAWLYTKFWDLVYNQTVWLPSIMYLSSMVTFCYQLPSRWRTMWCCQSRWKYQHSFNDFLWECAAAKCFPTINFLHQKKSFILAAESFSVIVWIQSPTKCVLKQYIMSQDTAREKWDVRASSRGTAWIGVKLTMLEEACVSRIDGLGCVQPSLKQDGPWKI